MRYVKKVDGEKIYLSPINIEDYEYYCKWINDQSISIPLGGIANMYSFSHEKRILEDLAKNKNCYNFAIILKENDELLGNVSLFEVNKTHQEATLGIFIGEKINRGKGYGKEALELILDYGFNYLNLHNIMLNVYDFNENAIKLYEKVGFKIFGKRTEVYYVDNRRYNQIFMEILKKDYGIKRIKRIY